MGEVRWQFRTFLLYMQQYNLWVLIGNSTKYSQDIYLCKKKNSGKDLAYHFHMPSHRWVCVWLSDISLTSSSCLTSSTDDQDILFAFSIVSGCIAASWHVALWEPASVLVPIWKLLTSVIHVQRQYFIENVGHSYSFSMVKSYFYFHNLSPKSISDWINSPHYVLEESNFNFRLCQVMWFRYSWRKMTKLFANSGDPNQMLPILVCTVWHLPFGRSPD